MRVAYCLRALFPHHGYGGLERSGTELMEYLLADGVDIALCTRRLPPGEPLHSQARPGRLTVHTADYGRLPLKPNGIPARLTNYRSFVEALGRRVSGLAHAGLIDAVYAHGLCAWGVRRAGEWGMPLVVNPHGMEEFKTQDPLKRLAYAPFRAWVRAGCRAADRIVATDGVMRDEVASLLKVDQSKVVVLPNGIDIEKALAYTNPQVQASLMEKWPFLRSGNSTLRGISVGRLEQNKGFEHLVRALGQANDELGAEWGWIVVGEGSLGPKLERLAAEIGVGRNVHFAGRVNDSDLHNLYELSNLFAHPTLYEGSSLVTLEAMAHGLAVVASATGGIPDKVTHGENGFLVAPGESTDLARRIIELDVNPQRRDEMGRRSAAAVRQFDWRHIAKATKGLLEELINERAACREEEVRPRAS